MGSISAMNDVCDDKIGRTPGAEGGGRRATVLAIGTANPANVVRQDEFPDYYFRVSKSEHLTNLKDKLRILCQKSGIRKRFLHMNEEMIGAHPDFNDRDLPSLEARTEITSTEVPKLAASAAAKAIAEWGRPATDITHIVFSTYSGTSAPSADLRLASLLGLRPSVCRTTLNLHGCAGGGKALHLAKDIAENNHGARVLVACSEISLIAYSGPREGCVDSILGPALFGDGAGAVILGAGPFTGAERPVFEMVSASQTTIPGSESALTMQFRGGGMDYHVGKQVPMLLHHNIGQCLRDVVGQLGIQLPWNDLFWAVHPGGRAILDCVEAVFGLEPEKLAASRHVLSEYGNMSSATVVFVLDEMRRRFGGEKKKGGQQEEVGDDEWGVMIAIGPGVTIETIVLRRTTTTTSDV